MGQGRYQNTCSLLKLTHFVSSFRGAVQTPIYILPTASRETTKIRNIQKGYAWQSALPSGYMPALLGVGIFAIGGVFDLVWHTLFGVEANIQALLSPSHLLLAHFYSLLHRFVLPGDGKKLAIGTHSCLPFFH